MKSNPSRRYLFANASNLMWRLQRTSGLGVSPYIVIGKEKSGIPDYIAINTPQTRLPNIPFQNPPIQIILKYIIYTISNGIFKKLATFSASAQSSLNGQGDTPFSSSTLQFFIYTAFTSYPYFSAQNLFILVVSINMQKQQSQHLQTIQ